MYQEHPVFVEPVGHSLIWRYMDFTKFVAMLDSKSLFFTRSDRFEDEFEGAQPERNIARRDLVIPKESHTYTSTIFERLRHFTAINCWHLNDVESAAMWKLYLKSNEGIAVVSTVERLKESITDPRAIHVGKVRYINYETETFGDGIIFNAFLHKRLSFEHEKELRALHFDWSNSKGPSEEGGDGSFNTSLPTFDFGINISVNVEELIYAVIVAPNSPSWIYELVKSVSQQYGYTFDVNRSSLEAKPRF